MQHDRPEQTGRRAGELVRTLRQMTAMASARAQSAPPDFIGNHPLVDQVRALIRKVAPTEATILLSGESGTGKDIVARMIHDQSKRARGPFVALNCAAVSNDLLESEMFGHQRGAFTDAHAARTGLFQFARGGTMFLDEIAEMTPALQVKLLRVLQEREVVPLGSGVGVKIDVRIIAASNRQLEQEVAEGRFREDLFHRLNVIPLALPPLRERRSDIPLFVAHFLGVQNDRHGTAVWITEEALVQLWQYDWPGNVRELENMIERLVVLSETGVVEPGDIPRALHALIVRADIPTAQFDDRGVDFVAAVDGFENGLIDRALLRTAGNRQAAATMLGMKRTTLVAKLARRVKLELDAAPPLAHADEAEGACSWGTGWTSGDLEAELPSPETVSRGLQSQASRAAPVTLAM